MAGQSFPLAIGKLLIGRDASQCQIVLAHAAISRCHAAIELDRLGVSELTDLSSSQGTFVIGEPVTRRELRDGDRLGFGPGGLIAFTYRSTNQGANQAGQIGQNDQANVVTPSGAAEAMRAQLISAATAGLSATPASKAVGAASFQASQAPLLRLGRAPDNEIVLDAPGVSRYHATLDYQGAQQPTITDLGSTNGTFINGEQLTEPRQLTAQDLIFIGGFVLRIEGRQIKRNDVSASRITAWRIIKEVPGRTLLKDISLAIAPREFVGLMGPSGCGKSTLMDALNGLRPATSGAVYVNDRIAETQEMLNSSGNIAAVRATETRSPERRAGLRQWLTLTGRYLEIKLKDKRNTSLLLLQAPMIAVILAIITGDALNDAKVLFIAAIISIWFGANNAVREIVAETPIYIRERLVNLKIPSYVFSKYTVLAGLALMQCLLFMGTLIGFGRFSGGDFGWLTLILYLTSLGGITMGLFFSALVRSSEKAMSVLPLILIPQLLLSGFLKPLEDLYVNATLGRPTTETEYRRYEVLKYQPASPARVARGEQVRPPDHIAKHEGIGAARYAGDAMIARWAIDGLAHTVSVNDRKARDRLATGMTIAGYEEVLSGKSEDQIADSYRRRVWLDLAALGGFNAAFLLLTMWALKRKDVL
ncbi:MAG: FHA domain-containing protein [Acidobacteria bacterium]|nr:FHA domain-containing protein [Acidobacteriota bacterium]